jgi:3-dehydroquinate synthase
MKVEVSFPSACVDYYFQSSFNDLALLAKNRKVILLTDEHLAAIFSKELEPYPTVVVPAGEENKSWQIVETISKQLIQLEADRTTLLVGVGGGMITDLTGFVASVYMRGIDFGFVPTSLLAMVDAAIGGKNGVNLGLYKNMLGTIRQPEFILFDTTFLQTLPQQEWSNGFAEIIKYACIFDADLWNKLSSNNLSFYQNNKAALDSLIQTCVAWKNKIVQEDEHEKNIRKLLNFGHTAGHALENSLCLPHGFAVGIGMLIACKISEQRGLNVTVRKELKELLKQYGLPTSISFESEAILDILKMDKKRKGNEIDFVILEEIGKASIRKVSFETILEALKNFNHESSH